MTKLPCKLNPADVVIIRDTREQTAIDLAPLKVIQGTLPTADFSVVGLENEIAIEWKANIGDLLTVVGRDRERFDREVQRLRGYPVRAIVIASTWAEVEEGQWRGKVTPAAVFGSIAGWQATGIPVSLVGNVDRSGRLISRLCYTAARRQWRSLRAMAGSATDR